MKILLIGNFGAKNIGDECILKLALEAYGPEKCIVMTHDPAWSQSFCGVAFETVPLPPTGLRSWGRFVVDRSYRKSILKLRAAQLDRIVFAGGGLFAILFRAVVLWTQVCIWLRFLAPKVEMRMEYQGFDRLGFGSQKMMRWVLRRADFISVRDRTSLEALKGLGIEDVVVQKDRVLESLEGRTVNNSPQKILLLNALSPIKAKVWDRLENKFPGYKYIYVCFDPRDKDFVPTGFKGQVVHPKSYESVLELFEKAEYAIGERLHFLIFGARLLGAEKTWTLHRPYSQKVMDLALHENIHIYTP